LPSFIGPHKFSLFPVVNGGQWKFSCIDCRDIGRAMVHLLELEIDKPETYLVKGFDLSWLELKSELDRFLGKPSRTLSLPKNLMMKMAYLMEKIYPYGSSPPVTRFDMEVLSTDTLFDDSKLRNTGFQCKYSLLDSFQDALD
jgi:nucleoside-diphosphate-sugar epimerase